MPSLRRTLAAVLLLACSTAAAPSPKPELPIAALWRKHAGAPLPGKPFEGPSLRVALFADGRIVFASDPTSWSSPLREGRLDEAAVARVQRELAATGVFELKGTTYLVPDAPVIAVLVREGGRQRMLYWDEVEAPGHGINVSPEPQHLALKKAWREIDRILRAAVPAQSRPASPPVVPDASWAVAEAIESE